jgi:hypothetical protein
VASFASIVAKCKKRDMFLCVILSIAKVMLVFHATWCPASGSAASMG